MEELREFRKKVGLSQEKMARRIDVTVSYYSQIERGIVPAGKGFIIKMKLVFPEINIDNMFFNEHELSKAVI